MPAIYSLTKLQSISNILADNKKPSYSIKTTLFVHSVPNLGTGTIDLFQRGKVRQWEGGK